MLQAKSKNPDEPARKFNDYHVSLPSGILKIGDTSVQIIPASELANNNETPENSIVFTRVYHEESAHS